MKLSTKARANFMTATQKISHHNEFSIKCPPNPHWLMDEPLKQRVPSKIYGSSHISEEMNVVGNRNYRSQKEDGTICLDSV